MGIAMVASSPAARARGDDASKDDGARAPGSQCGVTASRLAQSGDGGSSNSQSRRDRGVAMLLRRQFWVGPDRHRRRGLCGKRRARVPSWEFRRSGSRAKVTPYGVSVLHRKYILRSPYTLMKPSLSGARTPARGWLNRHCVVGPDSCRVRIHRAEAGCCLASTSYSPADGDPVESARRELRPKIRRDLLPMTCPQTAGFRGAPRAPAGYGDCPTALGIRLSDPGRRCASSRIVSVSAEAADGADALGVSGIRDGRARILLEPFCHRM